MSSTDNKKLRFDALAGEYSTDLFRYAVWMCGDQTLAKDLVQETFLRAWRALDSLKDEKAAKGWLFTIIRREYARTFERKVPPLVDVDDVVVTDEANIQPETDSEIGILREAVGKLPKKYREPLLLQVVGGYSCKEIADQLGVSRSAVMTQLFRAREKLKDTLVDDVMRDDNVHELS